jgi:spore germination protein KA
VNNLIKFINQEFEYCNDLKYKKIKIGFKIYHLFYLETVCSSDRINNFILKSISSKSILTNINKTIPTPNLVKINNKDKINYYLYNGYTIIINQNNTYALETKGDLDRSISESTTEPTLYGPKDSMVENIIKNLGLIKITAMKQPF